MTTGQHYPGHPGPIPQLGGLASAAHHPLDLLHCLHAARRSGHARPPAGADRNPYSQIALLLDSAPTRTVAAVQQVEDGLVVNPAVLAEADAAGAAVGEATDAAATEGGLEGVQGGGSECGEAETAVPGAAAAADLVSSANADLLLGSVSGIQHPRALNLVILPF